MSSSEFAVGTGDESELGDSGSAASNLMYGTSFHLETSFRVFFLPWLSSVLIGTLMATVKADPVIFLFIEAIDLFRVEMWDLELLSSAVCDSLACAAEMEDNSRKN